MSAVTFVVRPPIFCVRCGSAAATEVDKDDPRRRTLTCMQQGCSQYNKPAVIADPCVMVLTERHDGVVLTQETQ